jgi:hypothetical protein
MIDPTVYTWLPVFRSAVIETDLAQMPARLDDALKAIALRFCVPGRIDDDELTALADAQNALETLKSERGDGAV